MNYAIVVYGQYRSFAKNLKRNLEEIKVPILNGNTVDVYIVTDRGGNYSEDNTARIISTFKEYGCNVRFVRLWEDLGEYHAQEKENARNYDGDCKHAYGKLAFTSNLWFRRYVTNSIVNEYIDANNLQYDLHMFMRLFDIELKQNAPGRVIRKAIESCITTSRLLMSIDTIFIAPKHIIDAVFSFGESFRVYHDSIWENPKLCNCFKSIDSCLYGLKNRPTYCSEVQVFAHIFHTIGSYRNIRYDWNGSRSAGNKSTLYHVRLCRQRKNV